MSFAAARFYNTSITNTLWSRLTFLLLGIIATTPWRRLPFLFLGIIATRCSRANTPWGHLPFLLRSIVIARFHLFDDAQVGSEGRGCAAFPCT